jgi:tyrosinase
MEGFQWRILYALTVLLLWTTPPTTAYNIKGATGGVNTATGQRPSRQDLTSFQNSGAAFDLFVLAFQQFQLEDQAQLLSLYQIDGRDDRAQIYTDRNAQR